jgi:anti-sigma factor ChrR (cupin superfamily)
MRRVLPVVGVVFLLCCLAVVALNAGDTNSPSGQHAAVVPSSLNWSPLLPGITMAVVSGDPNGNGPYVLRLKSVAGTKIPAHWHPTPENVTVLDGSFAVGMGDKFDEAGLQDLPVGGFVRIPAEMRHFALSRTESVVQVHGMGPFKVNFVNPADAPKAGSK